MDIITEIFTYLLTHKLLFTALIIAVITIVRRIILSQVRGDDFFVTETQRKWMSRTKNGTFILMLVIVFALWRSEISEFAFSLTAIAVAIVVASKEIILCFTGSIQRASSRSFRIGDWIEVGKICGEVIEHNMMATVIQEIDLHHGQYHYTGKTATLPNSMFFTYPVKNLNFMKRYVYHNFSIVVRDFVNLYPLLPTIITKIDHHSEDFIDVARRYNSVIEKHAGLDLPGSEPHIHISSSSTGEQIVHFMLFCPTERATHLEQDIRRDFMEEYERAFPAKIA
ncbi:mechanosensitive ion channel family protein [Photobacterium phosphoreum]|jgi:small-conductance mechanosensitive channel|uniref:mechanosensitive ion channel family protein n=1 Tax=Photobacterium phosphoreum TaxID=659 RepID=UPI0005D2DC85|nr:mechanosensitive ion channel family protein [Photobacterium phosphoreum]KJF86578.1 mechanosensitive ion channel protein MscS [Photobacterium phosphoreum]MCD9462586.1 mechanosensitive ion channel family protein [Photobacterium phosphoreum]MCD9474036.1 mechanosensitive ion channel [Photobacterium phosphoreum]MCD9477632.1 mechanosensitive ion channel [Photobacterium phosphoreum]MCD9502353.1 mechanosensitive ion channel [Photobacterium phosphoreum]